MRTISSYLTGGTEKLDMYTEANNKNTWRYNSKVEDTLEAFKHKICTKAFKSSLSSDEEYRNAIAAYFNLINFDDFMGKKSTKALFVAEYKRLEEIK